MKDETCGMAIKSLVELTAKMYTCIKDEHECKKLEGINHGVVEDEIKFENYKNILFNDATYMNHEMNRIQSKNHNKGNCRINKVSLSCYNDKKYILQDGYSIL